MSDNSTPSTPATVTLDELIALAVCAANTEDVEIHVLVDIGYDQPVSVPVTGVYASTYRNGQVIIVLDAT